MFHHGLRGVTFKVYETFWDRLHLASTQATLGAHTL